MALFLMVLFRLPAYVAGLISKKINGKARPELKNVAPSIIKVLGNNAVAPMVLSLGLPAVIELAKKKWCSSSCHKKFTSHGSPFGLKLKLLLKLDLLVLLAHLISQLLHQRVLLNLYMGQIQFLLLGLDLVKLLLSMIWQLLQWQWVKFKLQKEKGTKFPLERV